MAEVKVGDRVKVSDDVFERFDGLEGWVFEVDETVHEANWPVAVKFTENINDPHNFTNASVYRRADLEVVNA